MTLEERYFKVKEKLKKLSNELDDISKEIVKNGCKHIDIYEHIRHNDNGYGRWWKERHHSCLLCNFVVKVDYLKDENRD